MLRIFGRTTLVSQLMVRSEMRLSALTGIYGGPGSAQQAATQPIPPNYGLFCGLFRTLYALRQRGSQISHGTDGLRGRSSLAIEAGAERINQRSADHSAIGILSDRPRLIGRADTKADAYRQFGMTLD